MKEIPHARLNELRNIILDSDCLSLDLVLDAFDKTVKEYKEMWIEINGEEPERVDYSGDGYFDNDVNSPHWD